MTAFYVFRSVFMAFFGKYRGKAHPHESPLVMTGPLIILAVLSLGGGFIPLPHFLEPMFPKVAEESEKWLEYTAVAAGLIGISLAWLFFCPKPSVAKAGPRELTWN